MSFFAQKSLINARLMAVLAMGFASGLPLALTSSTLQAWFTETNVSLGMIGLLSFVGLPYSLKFIWAPLMDHFNVPLGGRRRGWILLSQVGLVICLGVLAYMNPVRQTSGMIMVAMSIAFLSASQDIAVDAYRADVLNAEERGMGAAYYVFAARLATLVAGGLALVFADHLGWQATYLFMSALMLVSIVATYRSPMVQTEGVAPNLMATVKAALSDLIQRDKIIPVLLFIMLYKFGDALALQLMTNFLLHGLGFSLTELALAYKVVSFVAMIAGAFVGGGLLTRWSLFKGLLLFGLAQTTSNLMFVLLALVGKNFALMAVSIFIENFCSGLSTAALIAFMMSLCHHRYTASQFALLSAITSLGRVFLGPVAALMVGHLGWAQFYWWSFVLCFPGLILLLSLKSEVSGYAHALAD